MSELKEWCEKCSGYGYTSNCRGIEKDCTVCDAKGWNKRTTQDSEEQEKCKHIARDYCDGANISLAYGVDYKCKYCPDCGKKLESE